MKEKSNITVVSPPEEGFCGSVSDLQNSYSVKLRKKMISQFFSPTR